jgi:hypothetical protein
MASTGTITFDDEFNSLQLHRTWQQGDNWQLIAPDSPDGRGGPNWGELGSQWWVNPYDPNTPINGIYSVSNGELNLSLLPTPSQDQSYIDQQAGAHMPYVGGILNNSPTNYQRYGYWEMGMSCNRVPGFSCEISLENVQLTGHWPPQINIGVSTDGSGNQTLQAHVYYGSTSSDYSQPIDGAQKHDYGVDWEPDYIAFYLDNAKVFQIVNPGGEYQADNMFAFLYTGADYSLGTGVNPPVSSLPASAHVDYFRVYDAKPPNATGAGNGGPPGPITVGTGSDTLVLSISEEAYQGDAQFTVSVDGKQFGGTFTGQASHAAGQHQTFTLNSDWGAGQHTITVDFLNDAWNGTPDTDRNLYVDGVLYDGTATGQSAALMSAGPRNFTVSDTTAIPATLPGTAAPSLPPLVPTAYYIAPGAGSFTDSSGNTYSVAGSTQAMENEGPIAGGYGTSAMEMANGKVMGQDASTGSWYDWNQQDWVPDSAPPGIPTISGGSETFSLANTDVIKAVLGASITTMTFAGGGRLDVTGGIGAMNYQYQASAGLLEIENFSPAKGDTLSIPTALKASMTVSTDQSGEIMLSFGDRHLIDLHTVSAVPAIHWT